jgi:hypothetical protein
MAAPGNGGDIIVTGGSVELEFDKSVYPADPSSPKKHKNANKKILKIQVLDEHGVEQYSHEDQSGLKWKIIITARG